MDKSTGVLYVVGTPIGNLDDISLRALAVLKEVDYILSEDTRETQKILQKFDIQTPQIPYTDQKHLRTYPVILNYLHNGKKLALVSDNGTPLICDPGFKLVKNLLMDNIAVESVPGPNAGISCLSISGLPTDKYYFLGFLPKNKPERIKILNECAPLRATLIIYESSHRIRNLMKELFTTLGDRLIFVGKDLTKLHQKTFIGHLHGFANEEILLPEKGEYVVLLAKKGYVL